MLTEAQSILTTKYNNNITNNVDISLSDYINGKMRETHTDDYTWYRDALSNKMYVEGHSQTIRIALGYRKIHKTTDPTQYGYRYDQPNGVWLLPNEFFYDGHVYDRSEIGRAHV